MIQFFPSLVGFRGFPPEFIITVKTDNAGVSASNEILLPIQGTAMVIDWGDGSVSTHTQTATPNNTIGGNNVIHTYASAGIYQIKISSSITRIAFNNGGDRIKLLDINNWNINPMIFQSSFNGCENLIGSFQNAPKFVANANINSMFAFCRIFNPISDINKWDVSNVTFFGNVFNGCTVFNKNLSSWDVSNSTSFSNFILACNNYEHSLGNFVLLPNVSLTGMLSVSNATIGTNLQEWYSRTLIGWANNIFSRGGVVTGRSLGANNRRYNNINYVSGQQFNNAVDARNYLVNTLGWTITGDAQV